MTVRFTLKDLSTHSVPSLRGLNLLAHAQLEEIDIGSVCGGHGVCGKDRVHVSGDEVSAITQIEQEHLSAAEIASGMRLACQCFPERDGAEILVTIPPVS